jgi:hypothetical protein
MTRQILNNEPMTDPAAETESTPRKFLGRIIRAARLDPGLYEEVEADKSAMGQAVGVVVLSGLAAGIGTIGHFGVYRYVIGWMVMDLILWFGWATMTYWIGTRFLPEPETKADLGELLRTLGFAAAPGLIRVVGILPGLMVPSIVVSRIWWLVAMVIAVRQALDYKSTFRAVGVCLIGWLVIILVQLLFMGFAS